jgi:hypothetical protein
VLLGYASEKPENPKLEKRGVASAGMALLPIHSDPAISGVREGKGSKPLPWFDYGGF